MPVTPLYAAPAFQRIAGDTWRPGGLRLTRHGLALCNFPHGARVLDLGCGSGASLALLHEAGFHAIGLDREYYLREPLPFVQGDVHHPPFPDQTFDGLVCECVLSLLDAPADALCNFSRLLRPGGKLLLTDLYIQNAGEQDGSPSGTCGSCLSGARTALEMKRLLKEGGLTILHFEDHTEELKSLAARLLWYGDTELCVLLRGKNPGTSSDQHCFRRPAAHEVRYGYGLWIATPLRSLHFYQGVLL